MQQAFSLLATELFTLSVKSFNKTARTEVTSESACSMVIVLQKTRKSILKAQLHLSHTAHTYTTDTHVAHNAPHTSKPLHLHPCGVYKVLSHNSAELRESNRQVGEGQKTLSNATTPINPVSQVTQARTKRLNPHLHVTGLMHSMHSGVVWWVCGIQWFAVGPA